MDIDALTAGLHSPTIAWNAKKRHIVERMTETECFSIAKRTTINLRDRSPEIRQYIKNASHSRQKFAKLLFTQELVNANQLSESEVIQYKRMARIAEAQKKHQKNTVDFLQNESGYRVCCLAYIAGENSLQPTSALLQQMESLAAQQDTLDQALMLSDLLGVMIKRASKYPEYNAEDQKKKYETVLVEYTANIRTALEQCTLHGADQSVCEYIEDQQAKQPQLNDSIHIAMRSFALIRECLELVNLGIIQNLTENTAPIIDQYPELSLIAA